MKEAQDKALNNQNTSNILIGMLERGELKQDADGDVSVAKGPNVIKNQADIDM